MVAFISTYKLLCHHVCLWCFPCLNCYVTVCVYKFIHLHGTCVHTMYFSAQDIHKYICDTYTFLRKNKCFLCTWTHTIVNSMGYTLWMTDVWLVADISKGPQRQWGLNLGQPRPGGMKEHRGNISGSSTSRWGVTPQPDPHWKNSWQLRNKLAPSQKSFRRFHCD